MDLRFRLRFIQGRRQDPYRQWSRRSAVPGIDHENDQRARLPEIQDEPKRKMAAPAYNRAVEKEINEDTKNMVVSNFDNDPEIKKKLFSSLGDSFEFEDFGQYNFYATANTQVPNDQKGFADFCYGDMVSGKEGNDFALIKNNPRIGSIVGQS